MVLRAWPEPFTSTVSAAPRATCCWARSSMRASPSTSSAAAWRACRCAAGRSTPSASSSMVSAGRGFECSSPTPISRTAGWARCWPSSTPRRCPRRWANEPRRSLRGWPKSRPAIHGTSVEKIEFHEVGAIDAIVDITGVVLGLHLLDVDWQQVMCSGLPTGSGWVRAQHGPLPVPAPATLELLRRAGAPLRRVPSEADTGELLTPTGAALLTTLGRFEPPTRMRSVDRIGYGFGSREMPWPNAVRVWVGDGPSTPSGLDPRPGGADRDQPGRRHARGARVRDGALARSGRAGRGLQSAAHEEEPTGRAAARARPAARRGPHGRAGAGAHHRARRARRNDRAPDRPPRRAHRHHPVGRRAREAQAARGARDRRARVRRLRPPGACRGRPAGRCLRRGSGFASSA